MKKISNIKRLSLPALMPLVLLAVGCTNTDTLDGIGVRGRSVTLSVAMPEEGMTRVGLGPDGDSKNFITTWDDADEVQVFVTQGDKSFAIGKVGVGNISEDRKSASIAFQLPEALDLTTSYSIHALSGIEGSMTGEGGEWRPVCTAELYRNVLTYFNAPLYCKLDVEKDFNPTLQFEHIGTYEVLHFTNSTDNLIKFEHDGFETEKPWYYKKAVGALLPEGGMALDAAASASGETASEFIYVAAGETNTFVSWYIPTGEKMGGAELKATVDGVSVKSANRKSSDINIETGHAYHMYATWDGESLTFDNGDAGILTVMPDTIDFGSVEAGTTQAMNFTVSNTGNADLTFEIESLHGIFEVPESGQSFTLPASGQKVFSIAFTPEAEEKDKSYSGVMTITSNGANGTVKVSVTGKSKSREQERLTQVIPDSLRNQFDDYIPIYDGSNPPNIEGEFIISPYELTYDSTEGYSAGYVFADRYIKFLNQDIINNTIDYQGKQANSETAGSGCFISGDGENFSVFFNTTGITHCTNYDVYVKQAIVISGTKTDNGIKDISYAFIFVEKSDDPDHELISAGSFRTFKDSDGMSEYNWWTGGASSVRRRVPSMERTLPGLLDVARKK